ncbi:ABC a-pheromone efflux pump AtrD [Talaromyces proteolyticus]|uniref:ABC a-pheromone efflux pump AtrD n=1 Tax=Talaromyces proteolyticus TaxID=1131652 RepID=A0AAD4KZQ3_9EURO|nr:ABC a-pheromone efflux pump AtrD [Talaromyces proteolyticus]KAH8700244.1 ABC a-pheromone efflux pump AtrD [Talaromyces proteolyticus]
MEDNFARQVSLEELLPRQRNASSPSDSIKKIEDSPIKVGWRSLFHFTTTRELPVLLAAFIFTIAIGAAKIIFAAYLGKLFEIFTQRGNGAISGQQMLEAAKQNILKLVIIGAATWILNACFLFAWVAFTELQVHRARKKLFTKLLDQDLMWFDMEDAGMGSFLSHVQKQLRELQIASAQPLGFVLQHTVQIVLAVCLAGYTSWKVMLVTMAGFPVSSALILFISFKMNPMITAQQSELAQASKFAYDAFASIDSVKCLNGESPIYSHLVSHIQKAARWYLKLAFLAAAQLSTARFTTFTMFVQGFWYGSSLVQSGELTSGHVLTTFWACLIAVQSVELAVHQLPTLERGKVAGETLMSYLRRPSARRLPLSAQRDGHTDFYNEDIKLKNVSFAYPFQPDRIVLKSVNMVFPAGKTVFIVGHSGAGKSSLVNLLLQFYSPTLGGILIGGTPFSAIDSSLIRRSFTIVQQNGFLFNETLSNNITFGNYNHLGVSSARMDMCIETASLRDTISRLPQGLDTTVGAGGNLLSGGQKQRVTIARARMKDSAVLILDEFTSALDFENRATIMEAVRKWRKGLTTIIITHDITNILEEDFVYVLEAGNIIASGLKKDLMMSGDLQILAYKDLDTHKSENEDSLESTSYLKQYLPRDNTESSWFSSTDGSKMLSPIQPIEIIERDSILPFRKEGDDSPLPTWHRNRWVSLKRLCSKHTSQRPARLRTGHSSHEDDSTPLPLYRTLLTIPSTLNTKQQILLATSIILAALHAAATPIFSYLLSQLFRSFYATQDRATMARKWSLGILGLAVGDAFVAFTMHYLLEYCSQAWMDALRTKAMRRILGQPCSWFDQNKNHAMQLTQCLDQNAEEIRNLAGRFGGLAIVAAMTALIAVVWSFSLNWKLTFVSLASAPLLYGISKGLESVNKKWERRTNDLNELVASIFSETFLDVRTVKAFTLERHFHSKHSRILQQAVKTGLKRGLYSSWIFGLSESAIVFASSLLFYYAAYLGASNASTITNIVSVLTMILFSLGYVVSLMSWIPQVNSANDTATRLIKLSRLSHGSSHENTGKLRVFEPFPIEFNDLSFCYTQRPGAMVLNHISFTIPDNTCLALVGISGSGKSTIAALLLGLYACPNPAPGKSASLTLGGVDIRQLHMSTLRTLIAYVPQHPRLFADSIRANITYGLDPYSRLNSMKNIEAAAEAAGIATFIQSLPEGYSTIVGEGGLALSGGQIQRLVIARALVRHRRVLILDEATSNLDAESAEIIRQSVRKLLLSARQGLTVILITHSVEMMQMADNVIVIDHGLVVEQGPYRSLLRRGGRLRDMLSASV